MEPEYLQLGIAAACGFVAALIFARSWLSAAIIGFMGAAPFAIFSAYMVTGGLEGAGFDSSKLPEGGIDMITFIVMFCLMFGLGGLTGGLIARAVRALSGR